MEESEKEIGLSSLQVWQKSRELVKMVYKVVLPQLPPEEKWELGSQLRRSVQSIPANIAEGYGRYYYQEGIRFCYIAKGSLEETYSHLTIALDLGYISQDQFNEISSSISELRKMLSGYLIYLKRVKRGEKEPGNPSGIREERSGYLLDEDENDTQTHDYLGA